MVITVVMSTWFLDSELSTCFWKFDPVDKHLVHHKVWLCKNIHQSWCHANNLKPYNYLVIFLVAGQCFHTTTNDSFQNVLRWYAHIIIHCQVPLLTHMIVCRIRIRSRYFYKAGKTGQTWPSWLGWPYPVSTLVGT